MRFLVGAACVAVIAFVGYYFWNEYSQAQAQAQYAQAKKRQEFTNNCWRIITTRPEYDKDYADSIGPAETINRLKKCVDYFETGRLPG